MFLHFSRRDIFLIKMKKTTSFVKQTQTKLKRFISQKKLYILCITVIVLFLVLYIYDFLQPTYNIEYTAYEETTEFSTADNVTGYDHFIVPNIVHFVHFRHSDLSFIEVVSIKAAILHQKPERLIIHCNCHTLSGKYWDMVKDIPNLEVQFLPQATHVFGKRLSYSYRNFHSSDLARIQILMKYGGIYLDSDSYMVKSLDPFRKFEMSIGWPPNQFLGTQVLVAHKNARFLRLWLDSYKHYDGSRWYYNAGELPTTSVLYSRPELVHRVPYLFGVHDLVDMLYAARSSDWKNFYAIHCLYRHRRRKYPKDPIKEFDEENIKAYDKTFGEMARLALYGTTDMVT